MFLLSLMEHIVVGFEGIENDTDELQAFFRLDTCRGIGAVDATVPDSMQDKLRQILLGFYSICQLKRDRRTIHVDHEGSTSLDLGLQDCIAPRAVGLFRGLRGCGTRMP